MLLLLPRELNSLTPLLLLLPQQRRLFMHVVLKLWITHRVFNKNKQTFDWPYFIYDWLHNNTQIIIVCSLSLFLIAKTQKSFANHKIDQPKNLSSLSLCVKQIFDCFIYPEGVRLHRGINSYLHKTGHGFLTLQGWNLWLTMTVINGFCPPF